MLMEKSINREGDQFVEEEKNKKERKEKKRRKKKERKRRKGERKRGKMKSAFRQSELIEPRSKVRIFDKGYTPRVKDSSYFGLFSTIRAVGLCLCLKGLFGRISKYGNASLFLSYTLAMF